MNLREYVVTFSTIFITLAPSINNQSEATNMTACTPSIEPGITVIVSDARTKAPLEATVILKDGKFQEEMRLQGATATGQIIYGGAFERPGVYTVTVSKDGYQSSVVREIRVTKDRCHVVTRNLKVALNPINHR